MPFWERPTCEKKTFSTCAITSLVLLVGLLVFIVIFLMFSGHGIAEKNDVEQQEEEALLQDLTRDPSDSTYDDCRPTAITVVQMLDPSTKLSQAWDGAAQKAKEPAHKYMEKKHSIAIYTYTNATLPPVTQDFKAAARTGERTDEKETSLYSDLSEAIQILKHSQVSCLRTHYGMETFLKQNISNKQMRFSTFLLSSFSWDMNSSRSASCFQIYTCFGAEVTYYSALKPSGQVLIPPYEVFKVTGIQKDTQLCKVVYRLKSNLNCVYDRESNTLHPIAALSMVGVWLIIIISSVIIASVLLLTVLLSCKLKAYTAVALQPGAARSQ